MNAKTLIGIFFFVVIVVGIGVLAYNEDIDYKTCKTKCLEWNGGRDVLIESECWCRDGAVYVKWDKERMSPK